METEETNEKIVKAQKHLRKAIIEMRSAAKTINQVKELDRKFAYDIYELGETADDLIILDNDLSEFLV